jgi:hypothetical protein
MFRIIAALFGRFSTRHIADAGADFDAELISRHAERKAILLRRAARFDDEGLHTIATELRHQAEALSLQRPLTMVALPTPSAPVKAMPNPTNGHATGISALMKKRK